MPPKQAKTDLAKKQKVVEDKTFGLKNKNKSKNVQKYVQSLQQSVQPKPDASKAAAKVWGYRNFLTSGFLDVVIWLLSFAEICNLTAGFFRYWQIVNWLLGFVKNWNSICRGKLQKKKDEEQARLKELNDIFKIAVVQPKVPVGMLFYLIMFND